MFNQELRLICSLAGIFALRMLGLCMLLPLFAVEARNFVAATPQLIGIAVGAYGLSQAILQVPFGMLSDRFGRRPLLLIGMVLLVLGSVVAYFATSIYGLIAGRILQGSGAIGSVIIATLIDHTREQVRARAMAVLGIAIGASFVIALVLGPWLTQALGIRAIFLLTAVLGCIGIAILFVTIPKIAARQASADVASLKHSLRLLGTNYKLLSLNFGIFVLHASLAGLFLVLPLLVQQTGFQSREVWQLYLFALLLALPLSLRFITQGEKRRQIDQLQIWSIASLALAEALLHVVSSRIGMFISLSVFFTAFCILEASLPTLVSKHAPQQHRGAAMGVYSSLQFLGVFFGGVLGGWLHGTFDIKAVIYFCMLLAVMWLLVSLMLRDKVNVEILESVNKEVNYG